MYLYISVISVYMFDKMCVWVCVGGGGGGYKDEKWKILRLLLKCLILVNLGCRYIYGCLWKVLGFWFLYDILLICMKLYI